MSWIQDTVVPETMRCSLALLGSRFRVWCSHGSFDAACEGHLSQTRCHCVAALLTARACCLPRAGHTHPPGMHGETRNWLRCGACARAAFVIYDGDSNRVLAARDAAGSQAMHWGVTHDGRFMFGSDVDDLAGCNPTATAFPAGACSPACCVRY